ncbi:BTAD domain-containing putative transcriptional regulator [Amycolatopsis sp. H20-H5]|uniref:BTAD domain-containing putative transcriptional regulator n=1 Tax=Amycolatopsis sp. H20-H5 TaxID=3046309 RepID=UPI002DBB8D77|nr:BTAD domain-containing putative transcriptional regulator [Amycolatopsis sp. H20-H5]MEC3977931.1 BTAD domain-containing putative transcriptional regulator [Amycolatopsis sp. H20-H5]
MRVALLGPIQAEGDDGTPRDIGGARLRMLLARLALDPGRPVSAESLIDGLWGEEPPADAANALQSLVSRLRKVLRADATGLESGPGGYRLVVTDVDVDTFRFERLRAEGRRELAAGRDSSAAALLTEALALWRGSALSDVLDAPFAAAPETRLEELRTDVVEDLFEAQLRAGRYAEVLADLEAAHAADPLRERFAGLRMRALAAAGRQSDALAVYADIRETLATQLGVDPSAELQEIHLAVLRGELTAPAPVADHLPVRLTSFVGREDELKLLTELLAGARLVTLVGPGGAGKTRLATEAATRHPVHAGGRVWFVPLAGVRDADDLVGAVLGALEAWDRRTAVPGEALRRPQDALERIAETLGAGESLLVLDNCEHLVDAAAALANELLTRVGNRRILATSREPLAIDGETLCPLGPLAVPGERATVAEAGELGAIRLFLDRAMAVRPDFRLDESTVDDVAQICRRLDGMPLALELAAARLRSMAVAQIAQRLDDRFRLLTSGSRTALPRQRTLRAVVEWSWDLLTEPERVLARRLSIFAAGADVAAVERVCAGELLPAADVLYVLGSLVEKSIVDAVRGERGEPRYRMLETIRAYGAERLDDAGEGPALALAFRGHFVELVGRIEPVLRTAAQLDAIAVYESDGDNMVTALRSAIDESDVDSSSALLGGLIWFWMMQGDSERAIGFVAEVLAFGDRLAEDFTVVFRAVQAMTEMFPGSPRITDVAAIVEDCVRIDAIDRFPVLAMGLPMLAFLSRDKALAKREIERVRHRSDPWTRAAAAWVSSFILGDDGDLEGAARACDEAYEGFRAVGDRWGTAMALASMADALSHSGDNAAAIEALQRGLRLAQELRSVDDTVQHRWRLATERSRGGDPGGAKAEMAEAERHARESGSDQLVVMVLFGKVEILLRCGEVEEAVEMAARFRARSAEVPLPGNFAVEWGGLLDARLSLAQGLTADAEKGVTAVVKATVDRGDMPDLATAVELLAEVRWQQGKAEEAVRTLGLVQLVRGRLDLGSPEVRALVEALRNALGPERYEQLYAESSGRSQEDGLARLRAELDLD